MSDSNHKLRHLAFFDELATREDSSTEWRAALAGLAVLRLVDAWIEDGPRVVAADDWGTRSVRNAIDEIQGNEKLRTILLGVTEALECSTIVDMGVLAPRVMAYGQLLEYDAKWSLAEDVYESIVAHTHPAQEAEIATQAHLRRGICLRFMGDIPRSLAAYRTAGDIANSVNDMVGILRARIGEAKAAIARGNFPTAQQILDETIQRAHEHALPPVKSMALHDRSDVEFRTGNYELAIKMAYEALSIADSQVERDRILADIAGSFYLLGVRSAARDAYLILAATAQEQYGRWSATLNLMEIAAADGQEVLFEQYRRSITVADLPPQQEVLYWLQGGIGYESLGKFAEARAFLEKAQSFAEEQQLYQHVFEADRAIKTLGSKERQPAKRLPEFANEDVQEIAAWLREERREAGV